MKHLLANIVRKWGHLRLQPIHVYCCHHVCSVFDAAWMHPMDYLPTEDFKRIIVSMQRSGIVFISLTDAYKKLLDSQCPISFRLTNYAILTFDDGYASIGEVLPWLMKQKIPVTLFINSDYAEGRTFRDSSQESYLSTNEIENLVRNNNGLVQVGMHGMRHIDANTMSDKEFNDFVEQTVVETSKYVGYIPFWAYTWGRHNATADKILRAHEIVPVLMDGMKNYNDPLSIHRELLHTDGV